MSLLNSITQGPTKVGIRAVLAGVEKVGKTTLGCSAPKALLIPMEQGFVGVSIPKTSLVSDYAQLISTLDEIITEIQKGGFPYQSLVFDSATALERLIHNYVLRSDPTYAQGNKKALTMESALGGYGKAYQYANELFHGFLLRCDWLATYAQLNIIITSHVFASRMLDPVYGEYDSWDLLLHSPMNKKTHGKREMLTQWADLVGFLHEPMYVAEKEGSNLIRGISANQGRLMGITRTPSYVAGNRYGLTDSVSVPKEKGWNSVANAIYNSIGLDYFNRD